MLIRKLHHISRHLYRILLLAYPTQFRQTFGPHMEQVFDDLLLTATMRRGIIGILSVLFRVFLDLIKTASIERIQTMSSHRHTIIAATLLLPSLLFAFINITKYSLGFPAFYDVFSPLYPTGGSGITSNLTSLVIACGPVLALLVALRPMLAIQIERHETEIVGTIHLKPMLAPLVIVVGSLLVGAIFSLYLFVENFAPI